MPDHSHFRFQLWTLLFVVLVVSAGLAGYRAGWRWGNWSGQRDHRLHAVVYSISLNEEDTSRLIQTIKSRISPESWDTSGGTGSASFYQEKLVVLQNEATHAELTEFLRTMAER